MSGRNPPPPPALTDRSRPRQNTRHPSARSRSPINRDRRNLPSRFHDQKPRQESGHDYHTVARSRSPINRDRRNLPSRFQDERSNPRSRSSPIPYAGKQASSKGSLPPGPSPTGVVPFGLALDANTPSVSRVKVSEREIIRRILAPENVVIPRRVGEGARPIFEREELRDGMDRRMRDDVVEVLPEQRVVAIIREPVLPVHYLASSSMQATMAAPELPERQKTSTGMSYRLKPTDPTIFQSGDSRSRDPNFADRSLRDLDRDIRGGDLGLARGSGTLHPYERNPHFQDTGNSRKLDHRERPRRRTRSRSVTPPPMPPEVQRNLANRRGFHNTRGCGSSGTFLHDHDSRDRDNRDSSSRGRGNTGGRVFRRPRGGISRGGPSRFGGRNRSPGNWQHDMYDRERGEESLDSKRAGK